MNKNERLLNLVFALMNSRNGMTRSKIRVNIADYRNATSDASFERMFERDKRELKQMGFEIEVFQDDPLSDETSTYRIDVRNTFHMIDNLSAPERLILQIARISMKESGIQNPELEVKLESDAAISFLSGIGWNNRFDMMVMDSVLEGIKDRKKIEIIYRTFASDIDEIKKITPIRLYFRRGKLYLIGFDHSIADYRVYRFDRIASVPNILEFDNSLYSDQKILELEKFLLTSERQCCVSIKLRDNRELTGKAPDSISLNLSDDRIDIYFSDIDKNDLLSYLAGNIDNIQEINSIEFKESLRVYLLQGYSNV